MVASNTEEAAAGAPSTGSPPPTTRRVAGVILAGGEGRRLGGAIKANISIGGVRLIERVAGALRGRVQPILVAHGRLPLDALNLGEGFVPLADPDGLGRGPLAGLAAAARWAQSSRIPPDYLVTAAVDTPFLPHSLVARLLERLTADTDAVIARYGAQAYATNGLWRLAALHPLLSSDFEQYATRGLQAFASTLRTAHLDWPDDPHGNPFANVNTPEDLAKFEARTGA